MIRVIDTYKDILNNFSGNEFSLEIWKRYINNISPNLEKIIYDDLDLEVVSINDLISTINNVIYKKENLKKLHFSFLEVTKDLDNMVLNAFGKSLDIDIILYLGLCNGAGWVLKIDDRTTILLGVEKIIELDWYHIKSMYGLIYHELGHAYQDKYGTLERNFKKSSDFFLWQLFTEGVAMYFEQVLIGDYNYYHQFNQSELVWLDKNIKKIADDFDEDRFVMTTKNQRYFGDKCSYMGLGDVGYYLGSRFVQFIMKKFKFEEIINLDIDSINLLYNEFRKL